MRTVRDEEGARYVLIKESEGSSLLRDPETGETCYLPSEELEVVDGESPLVTATRGVPEPTRRVLLSCHDQQTLGLLLEIDAAGPISVRELLAAYDLCESDLHGMVTQLRAAGLLDECRVGGERGYATTETASVGLEALRE